MDPSDTYPDLLGTAFSHSSQRVAQMGSLLTSWAMVEARRRERRSIAAAGRKQQELARLQEQEHAARELARAGWAPAEDRRWLADADLLQTARAWSAAASYAGADPAAAAAAGRCEERLRSLHPYAMAWYDRLRGEGAGRFEAMREALPLFAREPQVRPGGPGAQRGALTAPADPRDAAGTASDQGRAIRVTQPTVSREREVSHDDPAPASGRNRLPAGRAGRVHGTEAAAGAVAPPAGIGTATVPTGGDADVPAQGVAAAGASVISPGDRTTVRLAGEGFPFSVADTVRAAAAGGVRSARAAGRAPGLVTAQVPVARRSRLPLP